MSFCVLFDSTFFLCTFGRFMRSYMLEKSPETRNAFFCVLKSVKNLFKLRSWWTPSDPTHPIRRVLPAQKKVPKKKFWSKNTCNTWEGRREVITKLLFERRHLLWVSFCLLKWVCEISWIILKGRASYFLTGSSVWGSEKILYLWSHRKCAYVIGVIMVFLFQMRPIFHQEVRLVLVGILAGILAGWRNDQVRVMATWSAQADKLTDWHLWSTEWKVTTTSNIFQL